MHPPSAGLIDEGVYQARVDEYLAFTTAKLDVETPAGVAAQLVRAHRDPNYTWDTGAATVAALQNDTFDRFDKWMDTRDFRVMYLHWVLALADGRSPSTTLAPDLLDAIRRAMVGNRYRYDDPLPSGVVDDQWYWSENHQIILLVDEYLAGKRFPSNTFTISGLSGAQSAARCRQPILDWIDERVRFGFFEWHSNVYMLKNITPLHTLVELGDDPVLVRAAGMLLDLCLLDMAAHTHKGVYVASRGRSYKKDKMSGRTEPTFTTNKFLFGDTDLAYADVRLAMAANDTATVYFCAAKRYRPPQVLVDIATAVQPGVVRERHGIFVDGAAPVIDRPEAPFGYDLADPANLNFWWGQGAVATWQTADALLAAAKKHPLLESPQLAQVKLLVDTNGGDPTRLKTFLQANHAAVNFGHLREANTYAWRGDDVSLAAVLDYRFGQMRDQVHAWVAAIDADTIVFTTHPRTDVVESTDWGADGKPGYWTGEASLPRSAQHERTGVHIYQPAWNEQTHPAMWALFKYRNFTHAYFPQDHFDEVSQIGNWTVGRKGRGYIALWSWRPTSWRVYDPAINATNGMTQPFDLVADGGPDNVWVVEVGEARDGDFDAWRATVTTSEPAVERNESGFTVRWTSPSSGNITFGSTGDFTVRGEAQPLADFPRHSSRFGTVDRTSTTYRVASDRANLTLDFATQTRTVG